MRWGRCTGTGSRGASNRSARRCCGSTRGQCMRLCCGWRTRGGSGRNGGLRRTSVRGGSTRWRRRGGDSWRAKPRAGRGSRGSSDGCCGWRASGKDFLAAEKRIMRSMLSRIWGAVRRREVETEIEEEVRGHMEMLAARFVAQGMTPAEAGYAARRQFGGVTQMKEHLREGRALPPLDVLVQDARHEIGRAHV